MPHKVFPHGALTPIADEIWQVTGSLKFPLPRNMTVVRLKSGGLLLYSAVALDDAGLKSLEALGRPEVMVVPHYFHVMDAAYYKKRYPELKVVALPDAAERLDIRVDGRPDEILPAYSVSHRVVPGLKYGEIMLELDGALLFTDLIGNVRGGGFALRMLGPPGGPPGIARIVRFRQIRDRQAVKSFLGELAGTPGWRLLLVSHGEPIREDVAGVLARASATL